MPQTKSSYRAKEKPTWKLCEDGWWDAMFGRTYAGWSVAHQCRVRVVKRKYQQYAFGWYCFNDAIDRMIGPFKTPAAAKRSCPLLKP